MESGTLSDAGFPEFAKTAVLFCHITARIEDRKNDGLLSDIHGTAFPTLAAMDAEGKVVAKLEGQRTIEGFRGLMKAGQEFIDLKRKADGEDAPARIDYFLRALKLHHFNLADGQKYRDSLKNLQADQRAKIDALLVVVEMGEVVEPLRKRKEKDPAKVKEMRAEAGRKFWAMHKAGRIPAEDNDFGNFYSTILDSAEHDKDIPTFELALKILQERFPKAPKKFFDGKLEILERLKAEKEAPKEDKK